MSTVSFVKYQATGNDFILIDNRNGEFDISLVAKLCHRKFGIGADGLILFDSGMRIFNQDGREAAMCGNGLRCLVKFIHDDLGIKDKIFDAEIDGANVIVNMGVPKDFQMKHGKCFVNTGVPHIVEFVSDLENVQPTVTNFNHNFVEVNEEINVRTFERGVGETLSCGTGAVAVGYTLTKLLGVQKISLSFKGGCLEIWEKQGNFFLMGPAEKIFSGQM